MVERRVLIVNGVEERRVDRKGNLQRKIAKTGARGKAGEREMFNLLEVGNRGAQNTGV